MYRPNGVLPSSTVHTNKMASTTSTTHGMPSMVVSRPRLVFATSATTTPATITAPIFSSVIDSGGATSPARAAPEVAVEHEQAREPHDDQQHDPGGRRAEPAAPEVVDEGVVHLDPAPHPRACAFGGTVR